MAGLAILKHTHDLSDEVLCERWVENPYFQFFCGEEFFQHRLAFDRSSLTRWRQRMGEEKLAGPDPGEPVGCHQDRARPSRPTSPRVIVDTTVQPKNVMFPTDAKLLNRARERLVRLAKKHGVELRQSYERVGKFALIKHQRYAHAKQFKRANRALRKLCDLSRPRHPRHRPQDRRRRRRLKSVFAQPLSLARRVRDQQPAPARAEGLFAARAGGGMHRQGQGAPALRVRRQGLGRHDAYAHARGGQFVAHVKALPGNPYDGHTLATVIPEMEAQIGNTIERILADKGYRGHNAPPDYKFRVFTSGQKRARDAQDQARAATPVRRRARASAISRPSTEWAETISPTAPATPPTPSSPPPATTSADCWPGWRSFCAPGSPAVIAAANAITESAPRSPESAFFTDDYRAIDIV